MIHPVICDGGEITPAEEVADIDCILHSHLYLLFLMYLYFYTSRRGLIYSIVYTLVCDGGENKPAEEVQFYLYLYFYFYSYMHPPCKGTLFTWAVRGMIHPVICDGGETRYFLTLVCQFVFLSDIMLFVFVFVYASSLQRYTFYLGGDRNDPSCDL